MLDLAYMLQQLQSELAAPSVTPVHSLLEVLHSTSVSRGVHMCVRIAKRGVVPLGQILRLLGDFVH
jgi:hypothetical protein